MSSPSKTVDITLTFYTTHTCEVHYGDRYLPYISTVNWDDRVITISQGLTGSVPGVEHWSLPGAVEELGRLVTRIPYLNMYGQFGYGMPCKIIFEVTALSPDYPGQASAGEVPDA